MNLVEIGHVNTEIPDQQAATAFYIDALGLTRDPEYFTGTNNMWINVGRHQFHLPTAERPQHWRGTVGLVVPDPAAVRARLSALGMPYEAAGEALEVRSPWRNRLRLHAPNARFGPAPLALAYAEYDVPAGTAAPIAAFYREIVGARAEHDPARRTATVHAGSQALIFRESDDPIEPYDGHHIQVYVDDFTTPHAKLAERNLISAENGEHQYRFVDIVDPATGHVCVQLEHEVRSLNHPMFGRALANRDPAWQSA